MTYERIKYAALDARVSFEIAARSKELVAKPSPTENENSSIQVCELYIGIYILSF